MTEKRPPYETGHATLDDARDSVGRLDRLFDYVLDRLERLARRVAQLEMELALMTAERDAWREKARRLEAWKKSLTSWTAEDSSEPQREKARGK